MPSKRRPYPKVAARCWEAGKTETGEAHTEHRIVMLRTSPGSPLALHVGEMEVSAKAVEGRVTFLPAGTRWHAEAIVGQVRADVIDLPDAWVSAACGEPAGPWRIALDVRAPRIAETARWLSRRHNPDGDESDVLVERLLARLVASSFGHLARRGDDAWLPAATLGRVHSIVAAVGLAQASLEDLAKDAGLGISAYSRGFRGSTGWTPGDYLINLRMQRVATLLATSDMPMTEIARHVGFASSAHAAHQFRVRHRVSVERFRSAARRDRSS